MNVFCAAVDWGTSRFRLWLLAGDGSVLAETSSEEGLIHAAQHGFQAILEKHLATFGCRDDLPVVICGMAGARQGWAEARYVDAPANLEQILSGSVAIANTDRDIRILPGIAQRRANCPDVMRGEETQLLGLIRSGAIASEGSHLVCMPGTHSKWVELDGGMVMRFSTFLSGELFSILSRHSVLKMSISESGRVASDNPVFLEKAQAAIHQPELFTAHLFAIRPAQLLDFTSPEDTLAALSGVIIGMEIAGALSRFGKPEHLILLASGNLGSLYQSAIEACGVRTTYLDAESAGRDGLYHAAKTLWSGESVELKSRKA
jgi:2-dehydro-3-deoxygalactonokinase